MANTAATLELPDVRMSGNELPDESLNQLAIWLVDAAIRDDVIAECQRRRDAQNGGDSA